MVNTRHLYHTLAAVLIAVAVVACSRNDPASLVSSAKSYLAKNDYKAAIIQLKNALQAAPDSAETRFLLGKALLESGEPGAAETEIRKALDLRYPEDEAYPLLARALLQQGQYKTLLSDLADHEFATPQARSEVLTSLGLAHLGLGERQKARASIEAALIAKPGDLYAMVAQAQLTAAESDLPGALKLVDAALAAAPDDIEALRLKADLQINQGQLDEGVKTLEHLLRVRPDSLPARLVLVATLARKGDVGRATAELEPVKKAMPQAPHTLYAEALIAYKRGDMAAAREAIQAVLSVAPDSVPAIYLSGLVNYQLGFFGAAEEALRTVIAKVPDDIAVRQVLAATYLRMGRSAQALEALEPALQRAPENAALLRAAAEIHLASNNPAKAAELYERANALDKGNVEGRVLLAQAQLAAGGDTARALRDLEAIVAANPSASAADLALISVHLRQREPDKALAVADAFAKKEPANPLAFNVKGVIYTSKRDFKAARPAFEEALKLDPNYAAVTYNLAQLELVERNLDVARKR